MMTAILLFAGVVSVSVVRVAIGDGRRKVDVVLGLIALLDTGLQSVRRQCT